MLAPGIIDHQHMQLERDSARVPVDQGDDRGPRQPILQVNLERGWRGGENQVFLLQIGLDPGEFQSDVLCRAGDQLAKRLCDAGQRTIPLRAGRFFRLRAAREIRQWALAHPDGIIHAHTSEGHGCACLALTGLHNRLLVTRRVDFPLKRGFIARRKYVGSVWRYIAISQAVGRVLITGGVDPARVTVIPDGVPPPVPGESDFDRSALRASLDLPADKLVVTCCAALVAHKGHRVLIDAWRLLEPRFPNACLLIVGSGPERGALEQQAHGLSRIRFAGWRDDMPRIWRISHLAVQPSLEEGLCSSLIDAQMRNVPIVASRAGGIGEVVVDGGSGILCPPGNERALADAVAELFTNVRRHTAMAGYYPPGGHPMSEKRMTDQHAEFYRASCLASR